MRRLRPWPVATELKSGDLELTTVQESIVYSRMELEVKTTEKVLHYRVGEWLPSDHAILENWLQKLIEEVDGYSDQATDHEEVDAAEFEEHGHTVYKVPLHPVIEDFKQLIENDAEINMLFHQMFSQVPKKSPYNKSPTGKPQVRHYQQMLRLINAVLTKAPEFNETGLVGFPINAILDWSMGTTGGFAAFLNAKVNSHLKKVLNEWGSFLKSSDSCYVLTDHPRKGWFGEDAMKKMPGFAVKFKCDPQKPHYGFTSWDDFFTREFRDGIRPVAAPDDDKVIVNACESAPYKLQTNVKRRGRFWIKSQLYSLEFMMANDPFVDQFVGGTVYQAFLSALSYHRWHSPVNGKVVKCFVKDGTYYSETLAEGYDSSGPNKSQGYITEVATRAIVFIQADNPHIGLMCFLAVGMAEVSTCKITVNEGQEVKKGQQLGMFHFGGSTHCLIFRPGVKIEFDFLGQTPGLNATNIAVNSLIATVPE